MCHTGRCKWESRDGDCKVTGRLPDDCRLRDPDDEDFDDYEPEYDPIEIFERQERKIDRLFSMESVARMSGLNY